MALNLHAFIYYVNINVFGLIVMIFSQVDHVYALEFLESQTGKKMENYFIMCFRIVALELLYTILFLI